MAKKVTARELDVMHPTEVRALLDTSTPENPIHLTLADGMVAFVLWQNNKALRGYRVYQQMPEGEQG